MMTSSFWEFSTRIYNRPGVAEALLRLQHEQGADVNLLLYCAWHAASGRGTLSPTGIAALDQALDPWREAIIRPLRALRERIKHEPALGTLPMAGDARDKVLAAELASERVAQQLLESLTRNRPAAVADAAGALDSSLQAYFSHLGLPAGTQQPLLEALQDAFGNN